MKTIKIDCDPRRSRKGAIAAMTAFLLLAIIGLVACALDIGGIAMTHTQLQAGADAASLAAGTELGPGLQFTKYQSGAFYAEKTPDQIVDLATPRGVEYAGYNSNAELSATVVDG